MVMGNELQFLLLFLGQLYEGKNLLEAILWSSRLGILP